MFKLREGQSCAGVPDRGTEDREEGAQGKPTEETLAGRDKGKGVRDCNDKNNGDVLVKKKALKGFLAACAFSTSMCLVLKRIS